VSVNCNGTHHDPERNCPRCVMWQVGYGVQAIQFPQCVLSDVVGATNATYPGWSPGRCNVRVFDAHDDRGDNPAMEDWDVGAFKGQCATNEYVAGISVHPGSGAPHSLLCCR
jgi:hypothetical protein